MKAIKLGSKILLWIIMFIVILTIAIFIFLNTPSGNRFLKNKVETYLAKKLHTKFSIGSIDLKFPDDLVLNQIYLEDLQKDTLLFGDQVTVQIALFKSIRGDIDFQKVSLSDIQLNIQRPSTDSIFNYQFVINAFAKPTQDQSSIKDTTALKLMLREVDLNNVSLKYNDLFSGTTMTAFVDTFNTRFKQFQVDKFQFKLTDLYVDGVAFKMISSKHNINNTNDSTPSTPLLLVIDKAALQRIDVNINDQINHFQTINHIETLALNNATFNMPLKEIEINKIHLANSNFDYTDAITNAIQPIDTVTNTTPTWKVAIEQIAIDTVQFARHNNAIKPIPGLDINHLLVSDASLIAQNIHYSSDSIHANVTQLHLREKSTLGIDTLHANIAYTNNQIAVDQLYLQTPQSLIKQSLLLEVESMKQPLLAPEKSKVSINLNQSRIAMNELYILVPSLAKSLPPVKYKNTVLYLNTIVSGSLKQLNIPTLHIRHDGGTDLTATAAITNITNTKLLQADIHLLPSKVSKYDLSNFMVLTPEALSHLPSLITISANAKGSLNELMTDIQLSASDLLLNMRAKLHELSNPEKIRYDVNIQQSEISKNMLLAFIPIEKQPKQISLPEFITLKGKIVGDRHNVQPDIILGGSYGYVAIDGAIKQFDIPEKSTYNVTLTSKAFEFGKLIKNDSLLQTATMTTHIQGRGYKPKTMNADIEASIQQIGLKQYNYANMQVKASINQGLLNANTSIDDPNIGLQSNAILNLNDDHINGLINLDIEKAQLNELHLSKDTMQLSFQSKVRIDQLDMLHPTVYVRADSISMKLNDRTLFVDSIIAKTVDSNNQQYLVLWSPMAEINAHGSFQYNKILPSFIHYLNGYVHVLKDTSITEPQQIVFNGLVRSHPLITYMIPGLVKMDSITINGLYDTKIADSSFQLSINAPYVHYQDKQLYRGRVNFLDINQQLQYSIEADTIQTSTANLFATKIAGNATKDSVNIDMSTSNSNDRNRYMMGASVAIDKDQYTLHLHDRLLLNDQAWIVASDNAIVYSSQGFIVNHFNISNQQSSISIQSDQQQFNSPVNLSIKDFSIANITSLLNKDTLLASGNINANFTVSEFKKKLPAFIGSMQIDNLFFHQQAIGNIDIKANKVNDNTINAELSLSEHENDVHLIGNYYLNNTAKQFDADLKINHLNMSSIEPFTVGNISDSKGSLQGDIQLDGLFSEPHWNGQLNFVDPEFRFTKFGTRYKLDQQQIQFKHPDIILKQFTISDSLKNKIVIDGTLRSKTISQFNLDLDINSKNFIVVNTPRNTNDLVYGYAAVNTDIHVGGNTLSPNIEGAISFTEQTDATIILPEKNVSREAARSVVRFIDTDTFALPEKILFVPEGPEGSNLKSFINYNLNLDISPKAKLTVIIDPSTGDELELKGDAKIAVGVDPGGNILLAGNYNLNDGHYILHYQFLKREFKLLSGSTVSFGGDPLDAQVNIQAVYYANTSAIDLVGNELGDADSRTVNTFNQKIPFKVLLFLKGTFKKLDISFDIQMPDENKGLSNLIVTTVENKLTQLRADPSAINKQVFSLLVLNRFVGEQSTDFFKSNGNGLNDIARESVSKFLSAALDQIASDLIKGVNIDLNLNSYKDYRSGDQEQRTDLNIGVSKRFMDDRLTISVGKNLGVEGQDKSAKARQQSTASYMPDATINYKLSKDGRYMIRAYSKNKFEVILDGYIVETGLSFIVTMDYEKFAELFIRKQKTNNE